MEFDQIKQYWDDRAAADNSAQSTTQDFYLREIEFRVLRDVIDRYKAAQVMDLGCGDARTTARLAVQFPKAQFFGGDYSESMVKNAKNNVEGAGLNNLTVMLCDVTRPLPVTQLDLAYSTRCLINLPTWDSQKTALKGIAAAVRAGGHYVMVENFVEGQENFNQVRRDFGLPEIPVREHNLFFDRPSLLKFIEEDFDVVEEINISSSYYLVSRVIYSKICETQKTSPDYFDVHHAYAAQLPFSGEFGPVRMICMKKRK